MRWRRMLTELLACTRSASRPAWCTGSNGVNVLPGTGNTVQPDWVEGVFSKRSAARCRAVLSTGGAVGTGGSEAPICEAGTGPFEAQPDSNPASVRHTAATREAERAPADGKKDSACDIVRTGRSEAAAW
ncbi:hypothetical protein FQZ97_1027840 [compost metagenome]